MTVLEILRTLETLDHIDLKIIEERAFNIRINRDEKLCRERKERLYNLTEELK